MSRLVTSGFREGDDGAAVEILGRWDGGPISDPLFTVLAGMLPQPVVEMVILRANQETGAIEVLLIERPEGDPVWPGMIHTPGTALRWADFNHTQGVLAAAFERLRGLGGESGLDFSEPQFVKVIHRMVRRGPEVAQIFWAWVYGDPVLAAGARWVHVRELDSLDNLIEHHHEHIRLAVEAWHFSVQPPYGTLP